MAGYAAGFSGLESFLSLSLSLSLLRSIFPFMQSRSVTCGKARKEIKSEKSEVHQEKKQRKK